MSILKEKREKATRTLELARAKLNEVTAETPEARAAEINREFDAAMIEYDKIDADIRRLEKIEEADRREAERREADERQRRRPGAGDATAPGAHDPAGGEKPTIKRAFRDAMIYGIANISEEARSVLIAGGGGQVDPSKSPELRALTTGTGSSGGYTVPTEFLPRLERTMAIYGPMLDPNAVDILTTEGGNPLEFPSIDDTARRGSQFAENAAITDDAGEDPVFGQVTLSAFMHNSEIVRVPLQLLTDSAFDIETRLMPDLFGERMARTANDKLTIADGSSKPQGIVVGAGAGLTAAAVAAIAADELIDLQHTVNPAYRASPKCAWMFNDTVLKMIRKLKDSENRYIWQPPNLQTGEPGTLLGKPYWINPSMVNPAAGTKPIVFGDLSKYLVRRAGGFDIFVFRERYMDNMQFGFMAFGRFDGKVINTAAIKVLTMAAS